MLTKAKATPLVAEFLGAAIWTFVALVLSQTTSVSYFIATSVALALVLVYMLFNGVSGGHFNPAITFGMWTARRMGSVRAVSYIVVQLLGGLASWRLFEYVTGHSIVSKTTNWSTSIWLAEVVGTAIVAMAFAATVYKKLDALNAAFTLGTALFVGVLVAATASAGYLNPAVALGQRNFNAVYILGPLVGGLVGVNLYNWLFAGAKIKVTSFKKK